MIKKEEQLVNSLTLVLVNKSHQKINKERVLHACAAYEGRVVVPGGKTTLNDNIYLNTVEAKSCDKYLVICA